MLNHSRRRTLGYASALVVALVAAIGATRRSEAAVRAGAIDTTVAASPIRFGSASEAVRFVDDSLRGRSGELLSGFIAPDRDTPASTAFVQLFGDSAIAEPGLYPVDDDLLSHPFTFVALHAFAEKQNGRIGDYRIGSWPGERERVGADYANPAGFIEVTRANEDLRVSEHFRLRDFLTHDQSNVWPKYLVLRSDLVDKLELVIEELQRSGVPVTHMVVMSGFRTPQYNAGGGDTSGRSDVSRHMYGDASDVYVDNDENGMMDDLNHDGRVDYRDAQVILAAVDRVERAHPELVGGAGVYKGTHTHGPFIHIDVRGTRTRWGLTQ